MSRIATASLQRRLKLHGGEPGVVDGVHGPNTSAATHVVLTKGPDTPLTLGDYVDAAAKLRVDSRAIMAVAAVEAAGAAFFDGRPTILFEPHRFSRATAGKFDGSHPSISYPVWDRTRYPRSQAGRYDQLDAAIRIDPEVGFASASYGAFQILGENHLLCGYGSAAEFAFAMAHDEANQLDAFCWFLLSKGLDDALRRRDWATFAGGYNGTAYAANRYDTRLAAAYAKFGGPK